MKKLFENIEDIYIKGDISDLTEIVTTIDMALQNIADNSDQLANILLTYGSSNKGRQFEKVVTTSEALRDELHEASIELNDMQNQIVEYQDKIYRYEGLPMSAQRPNPYLVSRRSISYDTSEFQFNRTEMTQLCNLLKDYQNNVMQYLSKINEGRNSIGMIWQDSQYNDFSAFIDEVIKKISDALKVYSYYTEDLEARIKELS